MQPMQLCLIVAMARNRVIGLDNQLPWRLPKDLAHFKQITMGHPLVMGRKTFDSIGRPLPGRTNIVVTRQPGWQHSGVLPAASLAEALGKGRQAAEALGVNRVMLIGGATLYQQALPQCDRLYMTEVHAEYPGDTFFPALSYTHWREISREFCSGVAEESIPDYSFVVYERADEGVSSKGI